MPVTSHEEGGLLVNQDADLKVADLEQISDYISYAKVKFYIYQPNTYSGL